ncbi:hypothetical protein NPIL_692021 [Nephila pilipes]|uniref:Uncharacterized protein n=1 Tax=Nephila pilipes TaxID=299642 RepID=A0A8X6TS77_NEPPI|nr:hypothetical protein NPIL_692021 [Nephila pilipes]
MDACFKGFCLQEGTVPSKIFLEQVTSVKKTDTCSGRSVRQSVGRSRNDKVTSSLIRILISELGCRKLVSSTDESPRNGFNQQTHLEFLHLNTYSTKMKRMCCDCDQCESSDRKKNIKGSINK